MMDMLIKEAMEEALHYPKRGIGYQIKRLGKACLGRGFAPTDRINWPTGLVVNALMEYYLTDRSSEEAGQVLGVIKKYFDRWIAHGSKIYCLDDILSGVALIELHQITGAEKYKLALDKMVQYCFLHEKDGGGCMPYRPEQKNAHIYADSIGMVCPFLAKYGKLYADMSATNLAITQLVGFIECGMDEKTGIPYHGYEYETRIKYGIIGWGRAVGWVMLGMADALRYLDSEGPNYDTIKQAFRRLVDKVEAYQLEGGLYCWQLEAKESPVDTSASAMIIYAIARGLKEDILIGIHRSRMLRGRAGLLSSIKDGKVYGCLAECMGFCMYPQIYGAYPWSLGPTISLLAITKDVE